MKLPSFDASNYDETKNFILYFYDHWIVSKCNLNFNVYCQCFYNSGQILLSGIVLILAKFTKSDILHIYMSDFIIFFGRIILILAKFTKSDIYVRFHNSGQKLLGEIILILAKFTKSDT